MTTARVRWLVLCAVGIVGGGAARGADPRLGDLRTLDGYFPFQPVASAEAWRKRSAEIRARVQMAAGLWPMPTKTPLNAVVHGAIDCGNYTIEKVFFESFPGHFVTGNLYRPKGAAAGGKRPGVLMPHGHWPKGRFMDAGSDEVGRKKVREMLASGGERFESGARSPLQARCVQAARMGCVVFHYDMLGNADSVQLAEHRGGRPGEADDASGFGLGGAGAVARLQSRFGIQTYNGVRALDFLLGLPEVDPERILVTGASGGATQTMMLTAIEDRVRAAFPAVMVSTAMQGGCICENACYLRIGQGNIDIAALAAPRPLGVTAADDWTIELKTKGHPDLEALFKMLGAPGAYEAYFNLQFKHNYNHVSRTQMYGFLNRHFRLGMEEPVLEADFEFQSKEKLTVWDGAHPAPGGERVGAAHERALCRWWAEDAEAQVRGLLAPADARAIDRAREVIGGAVSVMIGRGVVAPADVAFAASGESQVDGFTEVRGVVMHRASGEEVKVALLKPAATKGEARAVLWVDRRGIAGMRDAGGALREEVKKILSAGVVVAALDPLRLGEQDNRQVEGKKISDGGEWQRDAAFTYGYNPPLFAQRVGDILSAVAWLRGSDGATRVMLAGVEGGGHWVAAARAVLGDAVTKAAADFADFRFSNLDSIWHPDFLPGAAKFGDIAGFLAMSAPRDLWVAGVSKEAGRTVQDYFKAAGAGDKLTLENRSGQPGTVRMVAWLLK